MNTLTAIEVRLERLDSEIYDLDKREQALLAQLEEIRQERDEKIRRMDAMTTTKLILKGEI